jgi:hypothetical protein
MKNRYFGDTLNNEEGIRKIDDAEVISSRRRAESEAYFVEGILVMTTLVLS